LRSNVIRSQPSARLALAGIAQLDLAVLDQVGGVAHFGGDGLIDRP
jgi:hypothetical protein